MDDRYVFPRSKLLRRMTQTDRIPLVIVACGSFSPITFLHLRMFELLSDYTRSQKKYEIIGMYLSPVSDAYHKISLAKASHRLAMCQLAVVQSSIMVDPWETTHDDYVRTAKVLEHFHHEINVVDGGVETVDGTIIHVHISLLGGADLLSTMATPGVWDSQDLDLILSKFGAMIIEREGIDTAAALSHLSKWVHNISIIPQTIRNDISSTKVRSFLLDAQSVRWLLPDAVREYIQEHRLYMKEKDEHLPTP